MSNDKKLVSISGIPIYRYKDREEECEAPSGETSMNEISDHIEQHIGKINVVFHEIVSDTVHIDVYHVSPRKKRPFHTLITSGMSDLPMNVPEDVEAPAYMELMATLPEYWEVNEASFKAEIWYWPIRMLKYLARFPHKYDTWLSWGHTIANGDPPEPFAENTKLNGVILLPSLIAPEEFYQLRINDKKEIHFLSVVPLFQEEMDMKLRKGTEALLERFDKYGINDIINPARKNVAKKRRGLF